MLHLSYPSPSVNYHVLIRSLELSLCSFDAKANDFSSLRFGVEGAEVPKNNEQSCHAKEMQGTITSPSPNDNSARMYDNDISLPYSYVSLS